MNIIVTGTVGFDYIMDYQGRFSDRIMPDKIHTLSLSFLVDTLKKQLGGTAGNIAYTLHLLGEKPVIVSSGGSDFSPYMDFLKKNRMATSGIKILDEVATGSYFVVTDMDDNQIGSYYVGAGKDNDRLSLLPFFKKDKKNLFVVISANGITAISNMVRVCQKKHIPYMYDPAFQIGMIDLSDLVKGITHASILIGNDYEIALIEKRLGWDHGKLLSSVPIVITTLGPKGSIIEKGHEKYTIGIASVKDIIDPTGAGDAYRGGFLAGYFRGFDLREAGQMGAVAASYTVELYGTMTHEYTKEEFSRRYKKAFGKKLLI